MTLSLVQPTLLDCLLVCHSAARDERDQVQALSGQDYDGDDMAIWLFNVPGPKWAAKDDSGGVQVVAGFTPARRGVYTAYFMARSDTWPTHGREITRLARLIIKQMLKYGDGTEQECRRIERSVLASRELPKRWYGTIGLTFESAMRNYGANGETFDMYVALKEPEIV